MNCHLSIIISNNSVELNIIKHVISLLKQYFDCIEYMFINHFTPDNGIKDSQEVLVSHLKIINNNINLNYIATIEMVVLNFSGGYNIQIDVDDWCGIGINSSLYKRSRS